MAELGSCGEGGVQLINAADIFSFFEERQKQVAELDELYRSGKAPIHRFLCRPLSGSTCVGRIVRPAAPPGPLRMHERTKHVPRITA